MGEVEEGRRGTEEEGERGRWGEVEEGRGGKEAKSRGIGRSGEESRGRAEWGLPTRRTFLQSRVIQTTQDTKGKGDKSRKKGRIQSTRRERQGDERRRSLPGPAPARSGSSAATPSPPPLTDYVMRVTQAWLYGVG